jgi:hypothetical protein
MSDTTTMDDLADAPSLATNLSPSTFDVTRHDGMVTIHNTATGNHRTFRIRTCPKGDFARRRIVSLLVGPDTSSGGDWQSFAFADDFGVKPWRKFRGQDGRRSDWEVFAGMLEDPTKWEGKGARYLIEGRCRRCYRVLTVPSSLASGLGPECERKSG